MLSVKKRIYTPHQLRIAQFNNSEKPLHNSTTKVQQPCQEYQPAAPPNNAKSESHNVNLVSYMQQTHISAYNYLPINGTIHCQPKRGIILAGPVHIWLANGALKLNTK